MQSTIDPESNKLCNNCVIREERRAPKEKEKMDTIEILVKCPNNIYRDIEEVCINNGTNPSDYLLTLHYVEQAKISSIYPEKVEAAPVRETYFKEETKEVQNKGKKK